MRHHPVEHHPALAQPTIKANHIIERVAAERHLLDQLAADGHVAAAGQQHLVVFHLRLRGQEDQAGVVVPIGDVQAEHLRVELLLDCQIVDVDPDMAKPERCVDCSRDQRYTCGMTSAHSSCSELSTRSCEIPEPQFNSAKIPDSPSSACSSRSRSATWAAVPTITLSRSTSS